MLVLVSHGSESLSIPASYICSMLLGSLSVSVLSRVPIFKVVRKGTQNLFSYVFYAFLCVYFIRPRTTSETHSGYKSYIFPGNTQGQNTQRQFIKTCVLNALGVFTFSKIPPSTVKKHSGKVDVFEFCKKAVFVPDVNIPLRDFRQINVSFTKLEMFTV